MHARIDRTDATAPEPQRTFLWIAGASGVGKATLIRSLAEGLPSSLRATFGVGPAIRCFGATIDRGWEERAASIDEIGQIPHGTTALIKWQAAIPASTFSELVAMRPYDIHRAVFLFRDAEAVLNDLDERERSRGAFDWDGHEIEHVDWNTLGVEKLRIGHDRYRDYFRRLRTEGFDVDAYDANQGADGIYVANGSYFDADL
jgi:hypothetical protein